MYKRIAPWPCFNGTIFIFSNKTFLFDIVTVFIHISKMKTMSVDTVLSRSTMDSIPIVHRTRSGRIYSPCIHTSTPEQFIHLIRSWLSAWDWMKRHPSLYTESQCDGAFQYILDTCIENSDIFRAPAAADFRRIVRHMEHLQSHPRKKYYMRKL